MQKRGVFSYFLSNFVANKLLYSMLYIKQMEPCGKASHDKKLKRDGKKEGALRQSGNRSVRS